MKRYRVAWDERTVAYGHSIARRVQELELPGPRLVASPDGTTIVTVDGRTYAAFDVVPGVDRASSYLRRRDRRLLLRRAGLSLGAFHRGLEGFEPQGRHHMAFTSLQGPRVRDRGWYEETVHTLRGAGLPGAARLETAADDLVEEIAVREAALAAADPPRTGLCLLALYLPGEGITLAQVAIPNKKNEITAAPTLIQYVDLRHKVVIGDALHTHRKISLQIGTAGGNYMWTVKANQPQLLQDLQDWFDTEIELSPGMGCPPKDFRSATIPNKGHGRIEVRTLTTSSQRTDYLDWPFLQQVFRLERRVTIQKTGKTRCEVTYGITSLSAEEASPEQLLLMLKSYWQIENGLHYRRDVTLHEDHTRFTKRSAAHNVAIINNIVLALITKANHRLVPSARRFFAAHPDKAISLLL